MTVVTEILDHMPPITKPRRKFLETLFATILVLRGRVNFLNLSRYCDLSERTLRRHFRTDFNFPLFNQLAIATACASSSPKIAVLDASFVHKSGKKTYGLSYFFNSCAGRAERGLEISTVALVDLAQNSAYAISTLQTEVCAAGLPATTTGAEETRVDFYLHHFAAVRPNFPAEVKYAVFDGYFAKQKFVDGIRALDLHVCGKLRVDANLRYLYRGAQKQRGRPRVYDGKVKFADLSRFDDLGEIEEHLHLYTAVCHHPTLRRCLRVVVLVNREKKDKPRFAVLFSTDTNQDAKEVYRYYKARYQIEFLFRDAKQHAGLEACQARDKAALHFHFNAALTSVNLTKIESQRRPPAEGARVFSMASWKQRAFNEHFLGMIISKLELEPTLIKNHPQYNFLKSYAAIAA